MIILLSLILRSESKQKNCLCICRKSCRLMPNFMSFVPNPQPIKSVPITSSAVKTMLPLEVVLSYRNQCRRKSGDTKQSFLILKRSYILERK
jgi:hypothetical protein